MDRTQVKPIASFAGWQPQAYMWNPVVLSPLRLGPTLPILERPTQAKFDIAEQERRDSGLASRHGHCGAQPHLMRGTLRLGAASRWPRPTQGDLVHFGARKRCGDAT